MSAQNTERSQKAGNNRIALKGGSYSLIISAIVLAILIAVNVLASVLPKTLTKLDISSQKLYSITSSTKAVVNALDKDVTIYWIVQADQEDSILENLLGKYEALSRHIEVVKKNPDTYPTFAAQYTDASVSNNSLIVECGKRNRYIPYTDIYPADIDYNTYSYVYSFDGEGVITSAIDYVVSDELPQLYVLEGHGEADLPSEFSEQIGKANLELTSFSLLNEDEIPEEADCVLIYAPASDISEEEKVILADHVRNGGKLMVLAGPAEKGTLTNLYGILGSYGFSPAEGIAVEADRSYYAFRQPYILLPNLKSSTVTDSLIDENYYVIMPLAQGLLRNETTSATVTELLTTSDTAFSKTAGFSLSTYEKEEGDIDGPFTLALSIEDGSGEIVWVTSSYFLDETYNAYSSGANLNFAMNALSTLVGEREAVAIRSKSLSYNYLTINESRATFIKVVLIGVLPLLFALTGISVIVDRKKGRHEQE